MARTKASVGAKVAAGKSSKARCCAATSSSSSSSSGSSDRASKAVSGGGGNPVCPQPTPKWQKTITNFFISKDKDAGSSSDDGAEASGSSRPRKRNVIESDDEEVQETTPQMQSVEERPKNSVLDESIELGPLTGEKSHKIEEYYSKNGINHNSEENGEEGKSENEENGTRIEENHTKNEENHTKNEENHTKNEENQTKIEDHIKNGENPKTSKGKGVGKKTKKDTVKEKENITVNIAVEKRKSVKRNFEDESLDSDNVVKKIKVN